MKAITETTLIPLTLVFTIMGLVWGAAVLASQVATHSDALNEVKVKQDAYTKNMEQVNIRLAVIEQMLKERR